MTPKKKAPKRENRSFVTIVAVLLIVGVATIAFVVNRGRPTATVLDMNQPLPPAQGYVMGSDSALVEIVEFGDFECPACGQFAAITGPDVKGRLVASGIARFRFVDHPLVSIHPNTMAAHNAAACANTQGRFWEYHDRLFAEQPYWSSRNTSNPTRLLRGYARDLGLDTDAFNRCLDNRDHEAQIIANLQEGVRRGVQGTPNFMVGRRMWRSNITYDQLKALVDSAAAEALVSPPPAFTDTLR